MSQDHQLQQAKLTDDISEEAVSQRESPCNPRPTIVVLDGSIAPTGALIAAARAAELLQEIADFDLIVPSGAKLGATPLSSFKRVRELPLGRPRKTMRDLAFYPLRVFWSAILLRAHLHSTAATALWVNDLHLIEGPLCRVLGFRGRMISFVRMDPVRYGLLGKIWVTAQRLACDSLMPVSHFIAGRLPDGAQVPIFDAPPSWSEREHLEDIHRPIIVFVGNYIPGKGQDDAIKAFSICCRKHEKAELHFYGGTMGLQKNEDYKTRLYGLAEEYGLSDRVLFHDFATDTRSVLNCASVAINCSHSESFSFTCLEAAVVGLPVVATESGGPEEIISDGETGFLVPVGDIGSIADRLTWLLDHPDQALSMGKKGRRRVMSIFSQKELRTQLIDALGLEERLLCTTLS